MPQEQDAPVADLDAIDRRILDTLQRDARTTIKELSGALGLSTTPIHARVKRLERQGVIRGYVALLDPARIGRSLAVFCQVSLSTHSRAAVRGFVDQVGELPEVMGCYHVTGSFDFLLHVRVRDMAAYQDFVLNRIGAFAHIAQVQSAFVLTEVKHTTAFPLADQPPDAP